MAQVIDSTPEEAREILRDLDRAGVFRQMIADGYEPPIITDSMADVLTEALKELPALGSIDRDHPYDSGKCIRFGVGPLIGGTFGEPEGYVFAFEADADERDALTFRIFGVQARIDESEADRRGEYYLKSIRVSGEGAPHVPLWVLVRVEEFNEEVNPDRTLLVHRFDHMFDQKKLN